MSIAAAVLAQFEAQAGACDALGSPFTARLCRLLAERLDLSTGFGSRVLTWPGDPADANVALRACGAFHALARSGWEPDLAGLYPPHSASPEALRIAVNEALKHHDAFLTKFLDSAPQTNEVARSAVLLGAALTLAHASGLPVELLEIGASAGLNLGVDKYRYELSNGQVWGAPDAPLTIACEWRGHPPALTTPLTIASRRGCDLNPLDPASEADRSRLMSYIWADQPHRLTRTAAAIALAAAEHRTVARADAAEWIEQALAEPQIEGVARLVYHTIVWPYLPADIQRRIETALHSAGAGATRTTPLCHFAMEPDATQGSARLSLTLWPGGKTMILGRADFHGRWVEWGKAE